MFDLEFSNTNRKIENKKGDIYVLGEHLGSGEFSEIYKCENKIIKLIEVQNDGDELLILNEAKIHSNLMHDNIVNFYDFIYNKNEDEERNFGYGYGSEGFLVLEYCNYKDMSNLYKLTDNFRSLELIVKKSLIHQLVNAVKYLHSNLILHRDIKLENIFLHFKLVVGGLLKNNHINY